MTVQPDSGKLLRLSAGIHLGVEEVCYGFIIEGDTGNGCVLLDRYKVVYQEQVVRC